MNLLRFLRRRRQTSALKTRRPETLRLVSDLWLQNRTREPRFRWSWSVFWLAFGITAIITGYGWAIYLLLWSR